MNIIKQYKFDKCKCEILKSDIEIYKNDYLGLGDTKERWNTLEKLKNDYETKSKFVAAFEKILPLLSEEESLFIKYVYWENKNYKDFAYDLFDISVSASAMNNFCGVYKKYILKKLERVINS